MAILGGSSLRTLLLAAFTALTLGIVGTVGWLSYQASQRAVTTLARQLLAETAERIDQRLALTQSALRQVVAVNARLISQGLLDPTDRAGLERHFAAQLALFPELDSIGLVTDRHELRMLARTGPDDFLIRRFDDSTDGRLLHYQTDSSGQPGALLASRRNYDPHNDPPGRAWYPAVRAAGQGDWRLSVSLAKGPDQPLLVSFYAQPFDLAAREPGGEVKGVLVAGMTLVEMGDFLRELRVSAHGQTLLLDREGLLVATSTDEIPFDSQARTDHAQNVAVETRRRAATDSADPLTRALARQLLARQPSLPGLREPAAFAFSVEGTDYLALVATTTPTPERPDWLTLIVAPQSDFTALILDQLYEPLLFAGLALAIAILLGLLAARAISRPVEALNAACRRLAAGDFAQPLPPAPIRELGELGASFGRMTSRLRAAFDELGQTNQDLRRAEQALTTENQQLEARVAERTAALLTARDEVAAALNRVTASEAKFRAMFEQSPLGIALFDPETARLLEANDRLLGILGRTREDFLARGWEGITHPDDLPGELELVARLHAGAIDGFQREKRYLRADGGLVWCELRVGTLILGAAGPRLHLCMVEDITARKRAEFELQRSEERYRQAMEVNNDAVWELDLDAGAVTCNTRWYALYGYEPGEVPASYALWRQHLHPDDEAKCQRALDDYRQGRAPVYRSDYRIITRTGEVRWIHSTGRILAQNVAGQPLRMVGTDVDVTDRIAAEQRIQESLRLLQLATRAAEIGIWSWDIGTGKLEWDDRICDWYELSAEARRSGLYYDFWQSQVHPDDLGRSETKLREALRDQTPFEDVFRIQLPEERVRYIQAAAVIQPDAEGRPWRMVGVNRDITAQHWQEEVLRESEERFRLAFDNANTGMCLVDTQGRFIQVNDKMTSIFGYSREELMGLTVNDLTIPEDLNLSPEFIGRAVHGNGESATFEKRYRHRDGHLIHGQVASSLVRDPQGQPRYFISQVQDVTERKAYEHELREARATAEAASQAKSEFVAHMSHEIRTPLNVVLGLAQVLDRGPLRTDQRDMVHHIQTAGQSLLGLLNDILDLAKIEAGGLSIESRPFDLGTVLARVDSLMAQTARSKGLAFRIETGPTVPGAHPEPRPEHPPESRPESLPEPLPESGLASLPALPALTLLGDALRLEQILVNLIGNAIKFTARGEVTLSVDTRPSATGAVRLRCEIRDTGIGIEPGLLDAIFLPFTQADAGISRRFGGTGLGLPICKQLVELMGGEIGVESQVGAGSTFWFELPFARAAAEAATAAAAPTRESPPGGGPRLSGAHLLVVDDSALNRDLVERALALEGATSTLVADGQQALEQLKSRPGAFAAVLMDVRMPVMDGLTATRLIRGELGLTDLPVIALTAGVLPEEREATRAAGFSAILGKPLNLERMTTLLLTWVTPRPPAPGQPTLTAPPVPGPTAAGDFPAIAGIDRERAAETLSHNRDLFLRLLERFAEEYADAVDQTARELAQGEREQAARRIHTLRGGAGQIGALDLMALARSLEEAIDRGETDLAGPLADLGRQLSSLLAAIQAWRAPPAAEATLSHEANPTALPTIPSSMTSPPVPAPTLTVDELEALRTDLRRHNLRARHRFEDLRPALLGLLGEARTEDLAHAIRGLHYQEALAVLDEAPAGAVPCQTARETPP